VPPPKETPFRKRPQRERLQGVFEMAGAVCHELNQPLMAISGYTDFLAMKSVYGTLNRREFINVCALSAAGFATGCATNPVTGKSQLMLVSETQEIEIDRAYFLSGFIKLNRTEYTPAFSDFSTYDQKLPGNPYVIFYKGFSLEGQDRNSQAAQYYNKFLQVVRQGKQAQHAYNRLKEWGYIKS
jgi:hypothetical protein